MPPLSLCVFLQIPIYRTVISVRNTLSRGEGAQRAGVECGQKSEIWHHLKAFFALYCTPFHPRQLRCHPLPGRGYGVRCIIKQRYKSEFAEYLHYTQCAQKRKAFGIEFFLCAVIFQGVGAVLRKPAAVVLGSDAAAGVFF